MVEKINGPHQGQAVRMAGQPLTQARAAMVMIHGRGASAESILTLAGEFGQTDFAYLAPQAANFTWYPNRFIAPIESNEPGISSGLQAVADVLATIEAAGIEIEKTMLLGFSQGACLALEFVARHAKRYGGIVALSGGLIGPDGTHRNYAGSLDGTPIFIGCSDIDPHVPLERIRHSTAVLQNLGGDVTECIYPNMGHTVSMDEIAFVKGMMNTIVTG